MSAEENPVRNFVRQWWFRLVIAALFAYAVYALMLNEGGIFQVMELKSQRNALQAEIERLEAEKQRLEEEIELIEQYDPHIIEQEAREQGLIREGEEIYRLRYQEEPSESTSARR